jgi:hypothetical protein
VQRCPVALAFGFLTAVLQRPEPELLDSVPHAAESARAVIEPIVLVVALSTLRGMHVCGVARVAAGVYAARPGACRKPPWAVYIGSGEERATSFPLSSGADGQRPREAVARRLRQYPSRESRSNPRRFCGHATYARALTRGEKSAPDRQFVAFFTILLRQW